MLHISNENGRALFWIRLAEEGEASIDLAKRLILCCMAWSIVQAPTIQMMSSYFITVLESVV